MTMTHDPRRAGGGHNRSWHGQPWRPATARALTPRPATGAPDTDPARLLAGGRLGLTVAEAAAVLGISRALGYELVARGELPSVRLGRRLVVPKAALLELLGLGPRADG